MKQFDLCSINMWNFEVGLLALLAVFSSSVGADIDSDDCVKIKEVGSKTPFGYGTFWSSSQNVLYFVDHVLGNIYKYDPSTDTITSAFVGVGASVIVPVKGFQDQFLVTVNLTALLVSWDGVSSEATTLGVLFDESNDPTQFSFIAGAADFNGVFFTGSFGNISNDATGRETFQPNLATVYRYRKCSGSCSVDPVISPSSANIAFAWSPDNTLFYYIDSSKKTIDLFDYDLGSAQISNRRTFFNFTSNGFVDTEEHTFYPVGLTVDSEGYLWASVFSVNVLLEISTSGQLLRQIPIPTIFSSSLTWGGEDLSTLYLISTIVFRKPDEVASQSNAGSLFAITGLGKKGIPGTGYEVEICDPSS